MRAVVEAELGDTAKRLVKRATENGWSVVGVRSTGRGDLDGADVLSIRGRRGSGRFSVVFVDGSLDAVYWWARQHRAVVKGYREVENVTKARHGVNVGKKLVHDPELDEVVTWTTEAPVRTRLSSLAALVGVAGGKNPRPGLLSVDLDSTQE